MRERVNVLELRSIRGTGGGPEKTILLSAARMCSKQISVSVCYIRDRRDQSFDMDFRAQQLGADYIEVHERHSFDPAIWASLQRVIRARQVQIVHAHDYKTDLLAYLLAKRLDIVPLATAHGWIGNTPRERFYRYWDQRVLARFPLVLAVSGEIRHALINAGAKPERVRRVPNGVDTSAFRRDPEAGIRMRRALNLSAEQVVIGGVGRLAPEKRFDLLVQVTALLAAKIPVHLVLVGDGPERAAIEALVRQLDLTDRVQLVGHRRDVQDMYQVFDVYVQTSDTEGMPNAVLEAMALELPIVATRVGGTSELIDDGVHGLLVPRNDAPAIAGAIARTLADAGATRHRVAAARHRAESELSFDSRQRTVERLYTELNETERTNRPASSPLI